VCSSDLITVLANLNLSSLPHRTVPFLKGDPARRRSLNLLIAHF